jgi:hypothetical protein
MSNFEHITPYASQCKTFSWSMTTAHLYVDFVSYDTYRGVSPVRAPRQTRDAERADGILRRFLGVPTDIEVGRQRLLVFDGGSQRPPHVVWPAMRSKGAPVPFNTV